MEEEEARAAAARGAAAARCLANGLAEGRFSLINDDIMAKLRARNLSHRIPEEVSGGRRRGPENQLNSHIRTFDDAVPNSQKGNERSLKEVGERPLERSEQRRCTTWPRTDLRGP